MSDRVRCVCRSGALAGDKLMVIAFAPTDDSRSKVGSRLLAMLVALQRFTGHRLGIRVGRIFVAFANRGRSAPAPITIAYRASSAFLQPGGGTIVFHGGFNIEDHVQLKVNDGVISFGNDVRLHKGTMLTTANGAIHLGSGTRVGPYAVLYGRGEIRVGSKVMIGPHCTILAESHGTEYGVPYTDQPMTMRGVRIEDNVWIGAGATVLDGITIGTGAIVAAGSVVMKNVAPYTVVSGSPARVVRAVEASVAGAVVASRAEAAGVS